MALSTDPIIVICRANDSPLLFRAVTVNKAGVETLAVAADFAGITFTVVDTQSGEVSDGPPEALDPATVIDDTPPTTGLLAGMNFSFQLDGGVYLDKPRRRRSVKVEFELTGGETFARDFVVWTGKSRA